MASNTDPHNPWWTHWNLDLGETVYGPILGGTSVQEAVYNTLQKWLPSYIAEVNRQMGGQILQNVTEYRHRPEYRTLPKNVECAILVIVPGTAMAPQVFQDAVRANWKVEINAFIYGTKDWQETQALTNAYSACIRACLLQNRGLEGFAETTKWMGESYFEGEHSATRTTGLAKIDFQVTVGNAVSPFGGAPSPEYTPDGYPIVPNTDPLPPQPSADEVNVEIVKTPL